MSESWKNRLWSLLLVCTFAVVLSVCNKAMDSSSDGSSNSGTAFADGSTVTISSIPNIVVSSSSLNTINHFMVCFDGEIDSLKNYFRRCDSTDTTSFETIGTDPRSISVDNLYSNGFRPCPGGFTNGVYAFCK